MSVAAGPHAAPPSARPASAPGPDPRRWIALVALCTAGGMVVIDGAIVFVAIPSITAELSFPSGGVQWVFSAYLLTFGGLLLLGGRAADLVGRRRLFMAGLVLFTLASLACGLAWSGLILIAARAVQGVAAAMLTPSAQSILTTTFDNEAERNRALGVWGAVGGFGAAAGALIGGPITQLFGWEWIFFVNVPIGVVLLLVGPALLQESRETGLPRVLDLPGAITIAAAMALLVYVVVEAPVVGWFSGRTLGLLAVVVALLGLFIDIESKSEAPLVPLRFFRSRMLIGGNVLIFALGMGAAGIGLILTQYGQGVIGYSPAQYGLIDGLFSGASVVGSIVGQSLVTRWGLRPVGIASMVLVGIGSVALTQISVNGTFLNDIFLAMVLAGPGFGAGFVVASIAALSDVAESDAGLASGLNNTAFHIGGALGIAVLATVATSQSSGAEPLAALTRGYQAAFVVSVGFAVLGLFAAAWMLAAARRDEFGQPVIVGCRADLPPLAFAWGGVGGGLVDTRVGART